MGGLVVMGHGLAVRTQLAARTQLVRMQTLRTQMVGSHAVGSHAVGAVAPWPTQRSSQCSSESAFFCPDSAGSCLVRISPCSSTHTALQG